MTKNSRTFWVTLTFVVGLLSFAVWRGKSHYNALVVQQNQVSAQWQQVANHYQRYLQIVTNINYWLQNHPAYASEFSLTTDIEAFKQIDLGQNETKNMQLILEKQEKIEEQIRKISRFFPKEVGEDISLKNLLVEWEGIKNRISVEANRKYNPVVAAYQAELARFPNSLYVPFLPIKSFAMYGQK
ncbi:MAG: hypothetical protein ACKVTZ_23070 [Bacteroidia bacterium]